MEESAPYDSHPPGLPGRSHRSWLMLDRFIHRTDLDVEDDQCYDGTASAISHTCTGRPIRVSLRVADRPAVSRLHLHWPGWPESSGMKEPLVVAAHAHSILIEAIVPLEDMPGHLCCFPVDYFVYSAFSSPPSLHRLPTCFIGGVSTPDEDIYFKPHRCQQQRSMWHKEMGLLCHGDEGDFTVVDFTDADPGEGELCLLHHPGSSTSEREIEWKIKKVEFPKGHIGQNWNTDAILPICGRFLCWVDCYQGILVIDVLLANNNKSPDQQLNYIPLPKEALSDRIYFERNFPQPARSACVTLNGMIKLVCIEACQPRSRFKIRSWTLLNIFEGRWQTCDTMEDDEFWGLYNDRSLPQVKPMFPLVSLDYPDEICFVLKEENDTYWLIEVNMSKKVLKSSAIYISEEEELYTTALNVPMLMALLKETTLLARKFHKEKVEMIPCSRVRDNVPGLGIVSINPISCYQGTGRACRNIYNGHSFIPSEVSSYLDMMSSSDSWKLSKRLEKAKRCFVVLKKSRLEARTANLMECITEPKTDEVGSDQDIFSLRGVLKNSGRKFQQLECLVDKVQQLECRVDELQLKFDSSLSHLGSMCNTRAKPSIFLIGGHNGVTLLPSLDSFSPDKDILVGLTPMSSPRSYASAVALDGQIFAFGGLDGMSWYNTVECYSLRNNEWMECPSLNRKKGCLAGISLNGKIYAIGGGDDITAYSEVEMFDPYLGKWISSPSMLLSRFALAAAELNGVIYTAGGYDGSMYLESAERYDPREGFWVRLPSMSTRRGCHALTVLGDTLYAMGGYDGDKMVSSIEIYDPRLNTWRMGDPMPTPRGYGAAVNLDDSLFLIGGVQSSVQILDTVEVYSTNSGWSVLGFSSIGKRSFLSAVVM